MRYRLDALPDLYNALYKLCKVIDSLGGVSSASMSIPLLEAKVALAKARGEPKPTSLAVDEVKEKS